MYRTPALCPILVLVLVGCNSSGSGVAPDTSAPEVLFTSPWDGATGVAVSAVVTVTFSEPIDPATVTGSSFTLSAGGTGVPATVVSGETGASLTPNAPLRQGVAYTATVTTAVADRAGNALVANVSWTFVAGGAGADTTAPTVLLTSPSDGAQGVPTNTRIAVAFGEDIDPSTLNGASLTLVGPGAAPVAATVVAGQTGGTLIPAAVLSHDATYTATVSVAVTDRAGNPLASAVSWAFRTGRGPDVTPPRVLLTAPADGQSSVPRVPALGVVFDEAVDPATLTGASVRLLDPRGNPVPGTVTPFATGASFTPAAPLGLAWWYDLVIETAVTDLAGNPLARSYHSTLQVRDGVWRATELLETDDVGAAQYPQVAVDGAGHVFAVWYQYDGTRDKILANRYVPGVGWGTAELIDSGSVYAALNPQVAVDAAGNAIAVWQQSDGTRENVWANRYVAGVGWGTAELIESDDTGQAIDPQVAVDAAGNAIAVWAQYAGTRGSIAANRYVVGAGWGTAQLIESDDNGDAQYPQVALDPAGNGIAVWQQSDGTRVNIWANRYVAGTGWGQPELIESDDAGDAGYPQVVVDIAGNAIAAWHQSDGAVDGVWVNRYESGGTWGAAEKIDTAFGAAEFPQLAVDPGGNAVASWIQSDGPQWNVWACRYSSGAAWGSPELIETGTGNAFGPHVAFDAAGNAVAVWYQTDGITASIFANRYVVGIGWSVPRRIEADTGFALAPRVVIDAAGNATAVWGQILVGQTSILANRFD